MYIVEHIENLYASAKYGSADYEIACFLLMNIERLDRITLTEIAKATGCPKSTVSAFFSAYGLPGGFSAFQRGLQTEFGVKNLSISRHVEMCRSLAEKLSNYRAVDENDIRQLSAAALSADKFLIVGPVRYRDIFFTVIYYLRLLGIYTRYIPNSDMNTAGDLFETVSADKKILFLVPSDSYTEFVYKNESTPQFADSYRKIRGERYYLCRANDPSAPKENVFLFNPASNPYEWILSMMVFSADLFTECAERGNIESARSIYVL